MDRDCEKLVWSYIYEVFNRVVAERERVEAERYAFLLADERSSDVTTTVAQHVSMGKALSTYPQEAAR